MVTLYTARHALFAAGAEEEEVVADAPVHLCAAGNPVGYNPKRTIVELLSDARHVQHQGENHDRKCRQRPVEQNRLREWLPARLPTAGCGAPG